MVAGRIVSGFREARKPAGERIREKTSMAALMFGISLAMNRCGKVRILGSMRKTVFAHQIGSFLPIGERLRGTSGDEGEYFRAPT